MNDNKVSPLNFAEDFPPVSYDDWRRSVEAILHRESFEDALVSHTRDGIAMQPIYTNQPAASSVSSLLAPRALRSPLDIRQEYAGPSLDDTNRAIREDIKGGTTSVLLVLAQATRKGIALINSDDFLRLFDNVSLESVPIAMDAGAEFPRASELLTSLWDRFGFDCETVHGAVYADPIAALARDARHSFSIIESIERLSELCVESSSKYPHVTTIGIDTSVYNDSGVTDAQDLAFAIATAVEYLSAMLAKRMSIDEAAKQFVFRFSLGTQLFQSIAKVRAARLLWARVLELCGARLHDMTIHARTANRVLTTRDPHDNLLRNTACVFSAIVAGADVITSAPMNQAFEFPNSFSRRMARNTAIILDQEAHLNRVVDPAAGSGFLEQFTIDLAEKAWDFFQQVQQQGGMLESWQSGWIASQLNESREGQGTST